MMSRRGQLVMMSGCPCKYCKDKPYIPIDENLINLILELEKDIGKQIIITSGVRCPNYNRAIGGYWDSPHIPKPKGRALDIKAPGMDILDLAYACEKKGFKRIGIYPNHVHVDIVDPRPSRFWYVKSYGTNIIYSKYEKNLNKFLESIMGK